MSTAKSDVVVAVILGGLCALGPLAIDMYLPGFPAMVRDLATDAGTIQFSLMVFFAGLTLGQLVYGPLSDRLGRKPLVFVGLVLFTLGSIGGAVAWNVDTLLTARFVQGLGGSIGMVISTAVVRDLYTGYAAARLMASIMLVLGVSPVIAPVLGSAVLAVAGWPAIFAVQAVAGAVLLIVAALALPETRMAEMRAASRPSLAIRHYGRLLVSRQFIPFVLVAAIAQCGFFAYVSGSAFVFMTIHGLSPATYSVLFAVNSVGLMAANQASPFLSRRFGVYGAVRGAVLAYAMAAAALVVMDAAGIATLVSHAVLLFFVVSSVGMVLPLMSVRAMAGFGMIAGTAAALMGAIQFLGAALAAGVVGAFANGTSLPLTGFIAACGMMAFGIAVFGFPGTDAVPDTLRPQPAASR